MNAFFIVVLVVLLLIQFGSANARADRLMYNPPRSKIDRRELVIGALVSLALGIFYALLIIHLEKA